MWLCVFCGDEFNQEIKGCKIYDKLRENNSKRNFYAICDKCFDRKWSFLNIDEDPELIYGNPEIVYNRIFEAKGFITPKIISEILIEKIKYNATQPFPKIKIGNGKSPVLYSA